MARNKVRWLIASLLTLAVGCGSGQEERFATARSSYLEAMQAIEEGDAAQAISALTASIDLMPTAAAYMERAKLYAAADKQQEALKDSRAALDLDPDNTDAQWLLGEIEKPAKQRFQGQFKTPPSSGK